MFALGPALKISRSAVMTDLKEHPGEDVVRRRWKFLPRNPLVVVQIAFSLALLTAAALFIRGAGKAASVDTGLKPGASFLLEVDASLAGYEPKRAQALYQNLNAKLAALPGVEHVSISATVPFRMFELSRKVQRAGINPGADAKPLTAAEGLAFKAAWNSVGARLFFNRWIAGDSWSRVYRSRSNTTWSEVWQSLTSLLPKSFGRTVTRLDNAFSMQAKMRRRASAAEAPQVEGAPI